MLHIAVVPAGELSDKPVDERQFKELRIHDWLDHRPFLLSSRFVAEVDGPALAIGQLVLGLELLALAPCAVVIACVVAPRNQSSTGENLHTQLAAR